MKRIIIVFSIMSLIIVAMSCDRGDLSINPNAAGLGTVVNPDLFVSRLTNEIYNGGGTLDKYANYQAEGPWSQIMRWNQYYVSNYAYYWGSNTYNWTNSSNAFSMLKYAVLMEQQVNKQGLVNANADAYRAFVKFFKAYSFLWYTQRVGDIPFSQAGNPDNANPKFDTQHDVYKGCLVLLDSANTLMNNYLTANPSAANTAFSTGDIYGLTNLQWQKLINTYKLRVLISLSKRVDDHSADDLNVQAQFAAIVNNSDGAHPIMTTTADNMVYKYNSAYNPYPIKANGDQPYEIYTNMSDTYLKLTTPVADPRTYVVATPAPAAITAGKLPGDFAAFIGSDMNTSQSDLLTQSTNGAYSYVNYRYYATADGSSCEPYTIIGYSEMAFNIAEGINRGWAAGTADTWYTNGINASLGTYGLKQGQVYPINDLNGKSLGTATIDIATFMTNVALSGVQATALTQILQQKYVAMFQSSGYEAYYNWRRTGVPAFAEGGPGIGTSGSKIQRRWLYDNTEIVANQANYSTSIGTQYGGKDDVTMDIWLVK